MSIKTILTVFGGNESERHALTSAVRLAKGAWSHLRVVHLTELPVLPDIAMVSRYSGLGDGASATLDFLEFEIEAQAANARDVIRDECRAADLHFIEGAADEAASRLYMGEPCVSFRSLAGNFRSLLAEQAATADLIVVSHDNRPTGNLSPILAGLFEASRPVLAIPQAPAITLPGGGFGRNVLLAWDGSRASARALREAVPHMQRASNVEVVHVDDASDASGANQYEDVLAYLRSYCISASCRRLPRQGRRIGDLLLAHARAIDADLLVMGAYGRGHIGEMLLGGVTDDVVKATDRPVLLVR